MMTILTILGHILEVAVGLIIVLGTLAYILGRVVIHLWNN